MENLTFDFGDFSFPMIYVEGTGENPFWFGEDTRRFPVYIQSLYLSAFNVTGALWRHVMGENTDSPSLQNDNKPKEHISWNMINKVDGFLYRINNGPILQQLKKSNPGIKAFRLPSETEWEYAARAGKHWRENFLFSGSDNPYEVAWIKGNSDKVTHPVGQKKPNKLGIYDLCGNVWEWCADTHDYNTDLIPRDGSPYLGEGTARILRGGCHSNDGVHCIVSKRYEIAPDAADECIGFRLAIQL